MNGAYEGNHTSIEQLEAERERLQRLMLVSLRRGSAIAKRENLRKLDAIGKQIARLRAAADPAAMEDGQGTASEADERAALAEERRLATQLIDKTLDWVVERPQWFPQHVQGRPTVALPAQGHMAFWIPERTHTGHERFLKDNLRASAQSEWDSSRRCWTVSNAHFISLANVLLRRHPRIVLGREYNSSEKCNARCRSAQGHTCTCSCRARNHAGGKWMDGWSIEEELTGLTKGREWSWLTVSLA